MIRNGGHRDGHRFRSRQRGTKKGSLRRKRGACHRQEERREQVRVEGGRSNVSSRQTLDEALGLLEGAHEHGELLHRGVLVASATATRVGHGRGGERGRQKRGFEHRCRGGHRREGHGEGVGLEGLSVGAAAAAGGGLRSHGQCVCVRL